MTRRWALAAAFFLTAMFGFVVVAYGSNTGMFVWADRGAGNNAAQPPGSSRSTASPGIVTDLVYVDATAEAQQTSASAPAVSDSGERERDHEEREHDDDGNEREDDD